MNFTAFFSYAFLTAYTPGPNNIMSMANAGKYGLKKSFPFNMGVLAGFLIVMSFCAGFSSLLYDFIPDVRPVMIWLGAAYILWLAYSVWRDKPHEKKGGISQTNTVISGMLLQFVNVKVILFGITAMSSFVLPHYHSIAAAAGFAVLLAFIGFSGTCCWGICGAVFDKFFKRYKKLLNLVMALLLVFCAVSMILEQ